MCQLALLVDDVVVQVFSLEKSEHKIGRSRHSDIRIDDASVSKRHAVISMQPSQFLDGEFDIFIEDLNSRNGTRVNDRAVRRARLMPNDIIMIGWNRFKLLDDSTPSRQTTVLMALE